MLYHLNISSMSISTLSLLNRGSYMNAHVLLNVLNELRTSDKMLAEACRAFYRFFVTSLIYSIVQEHEC